MGIWPTASRKRTVQVAVQGGSRYLQSDWMGKFLKAFPKNGRFRRRFRAVQDTCHLGDCTYPPKHFQKSVAQAAVQGGSGYIPIERMCKFPKAFPNSCGQAAQAAKAGVRHSTWCRAGAVGAERTRLRGRNMCTHSHLETRNAHITHPIHPRTSRLEKT